MCFSAHLHVSQQQRPEGEGYGSHYCVVLLCADDLALNALGPTCLPNGMHSSADLEAAHGIAFQRERSRCVTHSCSLLLVHMRSPKWMHVVQEGDGNYTTSEPPTANATIARFVVIGGAPPATPSNRSTSSQLYLICMKGAPASAGQLNAGLPTRVMLGHLNSAPCCQCSWYPRSGAHRWCACMHLRLSSTMLLLHSFDISVFWPCCLPCACGC